MVEKIAADYWRLRRVLRFETGSIRKILDMAVNDYYEKADYFGEKAVQRSILQNLALLKRLQSMR